MTVLRCTAKLLKRLKQPAKPPEPETHANLLGEWYTVDFWRRQPFVVMLNAATGAVLVLPSNVDNLRRLHERALLQLAAICGHFGLQGSRVDAELDGFHAGFACANTCDRSLLSTLNQRKFAMWMRMEHRDGTLMEDATLEWDGLFKHSALGHNPRYNMDYHRPLALVMQHLVPTADVIPFPAVRR
jgi:hypothetical protein